MSQAPKAQHQRGDNKWLFIALALLGGHVCAMIVLLFFSTGDPSHHVVENYYQKAVDWDQQMEQQRANIALGWKISIELEPSESDGTTRLVATLVDDDGAPIPDAQVSLRAFPSARASRTIGLSLQPRQGGRYTARFSASRFGLWQFDFAVRAGSSHFTSTIARDVIPPRPAKRQKHPKAGGAAS